MASIETIPVTGEISPGLNRLLKDIPEEMSQEELQNVVASIKGTFRGNFEAQNDQDLYSCLLLLQKQGHVTDQNLTLLERFVAPMASRKEEIKQRIKEFKELRQLEVQPREELKGRNDDVQRVLAKLISGGQPVINLYGSSGVGKTTLAKEICSTGQWKRIIVDLREVSEMEDVYFHLMFALGTMQTVRTDEANPVIAQIQQLKQNTQGDILLLLDNVDQFAGGNELLNAKFISFLESLLDSNSGQDRTNLKILLTSRNQFPVSQAVDNYEVKSLEKSISGELIGPGGIHRIGSSEMNNLVEMCKGKPLLLNAVAAILRQETANPEQLLRAEIQEPAVSPPEKEKLERETFDIQKEGIDEQQHSCLRKIFFFLPSEQLKNAAVSMSLFCRPFSLDAAATVLGVDSSGAAILLEGLRNSKVLSVDPEAKELLYDIHPLMQRFLRSIGNSRKFKPVYQKANERFCNLFIGRIKDIAGMLDKDYLAAFYRYDVDKLNFELALDISFKSDHLLIPKEHHESIMVFYVFEAMLDEKRRRKIFNSWAEKAEDDGKEGSMIGAEMRCREALQVLRLDGWHKAKEVLKSADSSLSKVQEEYKTSDLYSLTRSTYLYTEGEVYYAVGNTARALESLQASLEIMEDLLKSHTSTTKCLNAIGNCYNKLDNFDEALDYYTRAYKMREELSGSKKHFDMPLFKGQIGTIYEGQKQYEQALQFYQEALELAEELNISGILYKAVFYRNIANTYAWMKEFEAAYKPAMKAYEIRKDILGIHPHTARSAFQLGEIFKSAEKFDEAEKYYAEAWKIEKSLGQGNHSEVRDKLVVSYENILQKERKEEFQKEALEFYKRIWEEEKSIEGFEFSESNRAIIDSINARVRDLGDSQLVKKYKREALWFYKRLWDEEKTIEGFEFSESNREIMDSINECVRDLGDSQLVKKYGRIALRFYEGAWKSAKLKQRPYIEKEDILQHVLEFCKRLSEIELFLKYQREALKFYEKQWKEKQAGMTVQDRKDLLHTLQKLASSQGNEKKTKKYEKLLEKLTRTEKSWTSWWSFGKTVPEYEESDDDDNKRDKGDDQEKLPPQQQQQQQQQKQQQAPQNLQSGLSAGASEDLQSKTKILLPEESLLKRDTKHTILRSRVKEEGDIWELTEAAALISFPPKAVTELMEITCSLWSPRTCSPPLGDNEALVSNVIELSCDGLAGRNLRRDFNEGVTLALSHSATDLKGYEVVIQQLTDPETNEWKDLETKNTWSESGIRGDPPLAEAKVTQYSSFAVIWRLKSFTFSSNTTSVTDPVFTCIVPEYPDASVAIPRSDLPESGDFSLTIKVQEVPYDQVKDDGMLVGPILHISSSPDVQFFEPVTIKIPFSLREAKKEALDLTSGQLRILCFNCGGKDPAWREITDELETPADVKDGVVTFQVKHFSKQACYAIASKRNRKPSLSKLQQFFKKPKMPQEAGFLACLRETRSSRALMLTLFCYPLQKKHDVTHAVSSSPKVLGQVQKNGIEKMCKDDKAFVSVMKRIKPLEDIDLENFFLKFLGDEPFERDMLVSVEEDGVPKVELAVRQENQQEGKLMCELFFSELQMPSSAPRTEDCSSTTSQANLSLTSAPLEVQEQQGNPSSHSSNTGVKVKQGTPSDEELEDVAVEIADSWESLGRRLNFNKGELTAFHKENEKYSEKAFKMLVSWKQKNGPRTSYQELYDALCHRLVRRTDMASKFCCVER